MMALGRLNIMVQILRQYLGYLFNEMIISVSVITFDRLYIDLSTIGMGLIGSCFVFCTSTVVSTLNTDLMDR